MSKNTIVTLITGAEKGLGREYAEQLGKKGQHIFIGAYDMDAGKKTQEELSAEGIAVDLVHCDITDQSTIDSAMAAIDKKFGYLNILLNNAGISGGAPKKPSETSDAFLRKVFDTNFFGTTAMVRTALPLLKKAPFGKILNVSSEMGSLTASMDKNSLFYHLNSFAYSASKSAVNWITVSFAKELEGTSVTVNSVDPGMTATDLLNKKAFEEHGAQSVADGARRGIEMASDPKNDANGTFTQEAGKVAW
ncbi:SDR family NAD(P)-dependent oxidoreductase [Secundilactobacillus pentosiphilus]|nr:SDR family NAD(P)-dependent oxidoreductase [Secundilactobacillus pentosiphilus]